MFIKSLILRGFKTFADKVEFNFSSDGAICAIVGPNGCGKSNVVDAFRFVLGENNIRDLRVNSLPEVIFAGTSARKPLSMAEVTLIIDNSTGFLPVEYSEVSVKRKTFKDGTSEFSINQQACRLKDIRGLFLDTGMSCDSLSIIGQGRVDAILSSSPQERRAFFEEVAGIHKYKTRKLEVERKLILCEQNLLRISDLKVEIGEQIIALSAQAEKAKEYKERQQRIRELELGAFKKQVVSLTSKKAEAGKKIGQLKEQAKELSERSKITSGEKSKFKEKIKDLDNEIEIAHRLIEETRVSIKNEQSGMLIERERNIFSEKNKLRDLAEEERFVKFEISEIENLARGFETKKADLKKQIAEWEENDPSELCELKPIVQLSLKAVEQLNFIAKALYGREGIVLKSHTEDRVSEMFRSELKKIEKEDISQADTLKSKQEKLHDLLNQESKLKAGLAALESQPIEKDPQNLAELKANIVKLQDNLNSLKSEKAKLQQALDDLEAQPSAPEAGADGLIAEEIAFAKIEGELLQIEDRVFGEYGMSREELISQTFIIENVARAKKEVEEQKGRLRELEPVNLLAIEEYEKVKERHLFIESQYSDLASARENLKTLIIELDLKAGEDFKRTMEVVASNFVEIFASLFEGGEAKIKVAEDGGIEISVCPCGRKWLNLSLLSGGERSLTAIALLLAFLKTQPSPICILDEVDAALDEANVSRFSRFLSGFSNKTEIIIITHNKRTMEAAGAIYGVTMEDPGVSKVVSMKLEKV